ncbi:Zn(II)2Cys6 transcription factor [Aspergillus clavatus NRRL 1]|uniref:C6 zinc finger domain protein n=1 Tax=Aspergillus clavatus (strain ATCC 1007 / CBS 513.65 / DSM 816 / NCTC 3887 / NRRL 1 / QM 1276 / 107) TaxID=344612 RepID=A1C5J8_ASPCL|nr:C6 zinc finger domain protein [Aspergillus clavatus NRRL 1]EAW14966.1 C6 zinc finger domain protein [Aspergillus clavatus NRRL 1]
MPHPPAETVPVSTFFRRPRRRPAHLRTKTGCLTCRSRKKKCDETGQPCDNCVKRKVVCVWPQERGAGKDLSRDAVEVVAVASDRTQLGQLQTSCSVTVGDGLGVNSPVLVPLNVHLFDYLQTVFLPQLIHPLAHGTFNEMVNREGLGLAFQHPFCMHALLACSAAEIPVENPQYRRMGQVYYAKAVAGLRLSLERSEPSDRWIVTLWTVLLLCIYERSKPHHSQGVDVHLAGAAQLIKMYFQPDIRGPRSIETEIRIRRLFLESFIFHVATSIPFQHASTQSATIDSAFSLAENILGLICRPHLSIDASSPVLAVPPKLFQYIYAIARIYQRYADGIDLEHCRELEQDLRQWDTVMAATTTPNLLLGPRLYVLCSRILLHRIIDADADKSSVIIDQLVTLAMDLVKQLHPTEDYFAEYYSWPFLVLGIYLTAASDQVLLQSQIRGFWQATKNGTMRRLLDMLAAFWDGGPDMRVWDNLWLIQGANPSDPVAVN